MREALFGAALAGQWRINDASALAEFGLDKGKLDLLSAAERWLVERELNELSSLLMSNPVREIDRSRLEAAHRASLSTYSEMGLRLPDIPLRVTDTFPAPYDRQPFRGLLIDHQDARDLNVDAGLYVRASGIYPYQGEQVVSHEAAHSLFSFVESKELVRGYEEGVCDVLSFVALSGMFGREIAYNIMSNQRFFLPGLRVTIYRDALREVSSHILSLGPQQWLDFLSSAQRHGRALFLQAENRLFSGRPLSDAIAPSTPALGSQSQATLEEISWLATRATSQPDAYVLPAEAYVVAEHASVGTLLSELESTLPCQLSPDEVASSIRLLEEDLYLLLTDSSGAVVSNEAHRYIEPRVCRFAVRSL